MKCTYCHHESEDAFAYCPNCGAPAEPETPPPSRNAVADRLMPALQNNNFMTICVLLSVSLGCSVLAGSMQLFTLLAAIFAWQIYASVKKNMLEVKNVRGLSGTVYAMYIVNYVLAAILLVCGLGLTGLLLGARELFVEAMEELQSEIFFPSSIAGLLASLPYLLVVISLVYGVGYFVINIFGFSRIHGFLKSTYLSLASGDLSTVKHARSAYVWLWVFGVVQGVSALSSLMNFYVFSAVSAGCLSAVYIMAAFLVKDAFLREEADA